MGNILPTDLSSNKAVCKAFSLDGRENSMEIDVKKGFSPPPRLGQACHRSRVNFRIKIGRSESAITELITVAFP